jgi:hypothetical protein
MLGEIRARHELGEKYAAQHANYIPPECHGDRAYLLAEVEAWERKFGGRTDYNDVLPKRSTTAELRQSRLE